LDAQNLGIKTLIGPKSGHQNARSHDL